jgi:microcystin-dependent protein
MLMWAGTTASVPTGYLWCDGTAVSRTTYTDLFTAIGTRWGAGNGTTTFNLPNTKTRYPRGTDNNFYPIGTMTSSNAEGHDLSALLTLNSSSVPADANYDGTTVEATVWAPSLQFNGNLEVHGIVETFVPAYIIKT